MVFVETKKIELSEQETLIKHLQKENEYLKGRVRELEEMDLK